MPFYVQLIVQYMAISTLTVELGASPRSGIVNVNVMFIFGMPIGHGVLNVLSTTVLVVEPTVYIIIRLQLTDAALSGGVSTLKTALP
jgi:hypothetical protein